MSESQQEKRRPGAQTESDRPKKKKTRAPKAEPSDAAQTAAQNCLEQHPIYEPHLLDEHLTSDVVAASKPEVEAEAMALFDASQSKVDYERFCPKEGTNNPTTNEFRSLWKVCLRVFEWSPVLLISPLHGLKYRSVATRAQQSESSHGPEDSEPPEEPDQADDTQDPTPSRSSKGRMPSEVIFPPDFSKLLTELIVHPCWKGDAVLFLLALQFTIKCRVNNRAPWPRDDFLYPVKSLRTLRSMFDEPDRESVGIAEMFNAVYNSQAEDDRSIFSGFLHLLGSQVKSTPSDVSQPQTYLGVDALPVTIKDLRFLTAAVKKFDWPTDSWNCSPDEVWRAYRLKRGLGKEEIPTTNAEAKSYTLRSLKDVYRDIARQLRASRDGASRLEVPDRGILGDSQEDAAQGGGEDIPIDDQLHLPPGDDIDMLAGNVSDIPRESTPFPPQPREREPRRKALVSGEETEDDEDLRRNQRSEDLSQDTQVMQGVTRRGQIGRGMFSGQSSQSPYTQFSATASFPRPPTLLAPLTPFAPRQTLGEGLDSDEQRLKSRLAYTERNIKRILDTQRSHSEAIGDLQRRTELQIRSDNQHGSVNVTATTQRVTVLETENEQLVQQNQALQERIDQMVKDAEQHQKQWSAKVKGSSPVLSGSQHSGPANGGRSSHGDDNVNNSLPDNGHNDCISDDGGYVPEGSILHASSLPPFNPGTSNMSTANDDSQGARRSGGPSVANIDESIRPIVEAILQRHGPVTPDVITDILQDGDSLMNEDWKQGDENGIQAKWQRCARKKSSDHVGMRGTNDDALRDLWHVCVRFFKQAPPVLFSPFNRLQFVPMIEGDSAVLSCHLFSKEACHAIADLIVHPIWQQDHRHFVNVLTYTANLRVGGTTNFHWLPLPHVDCPVLQSLNATLRSIEDKELPKTLHQLHVEADHDAIEYQEEPNFFSDFMISIAGHVTVENSPTSRELELMRHNIIPFRITDVECIQKTIDGFAYSDERLGVGRYVKAVSDAFKLLKRDEVPTRDQLRDFDARACRRMLRMVARPDIYGSLTLSPDWFSDREQMVSQSGQLARRSRSPHPSPESGPGTVR